MNKKVLATASTKTDKKKTSVKRHRPYDCDLIKRQNIELGQHLNILRCKHNMTYEDLEENFKAYMETLDRTSREKADAYDWTSMFKHFFTGYLVTIDYGTACLLLDFFTELDNASSPLPNK